MIGLLICLSLNTVNQPNDSILDASTFAKSVANFHPSAQYAALIPRYAKYDIMAARAFTEPNFNYGFDNKRFAGKTYWNISSAALTLPTITGIDLYGNFDLMNGEFLNPERNLPTQGLYAAGFKIPLAQGLLVNEQRFLLRTAKAGFRQAQWQSKAELNDILLFALIDYYEWSKAYNELKVNQIAEEISYQQLQQIKSTALLGDRPIIDTLESHIQWSNRQIARVESEIYWQKTSFQLRNHLWDSSLLIRLNNGKLFPPLLEEPGLSPILNNDSINNRLTLLPLHPDLQILDLATNILSEERKFKANKLLPKVDFKYNLLFDPNNMAMPVSNFGNDYYKAGLGISLPIFVRAERAALNQIKLKQQMLDLKIKEKTTILNNKLQSDYNEYLLTLENLETVRIVTDNYYKMLRAEEIRFNNGESSVFIINQRENMFFQSKIKLVATEAKWRVILLKYYHNSGVLADWLGIN